MTDKLTVTDAMIEAGRAAWQSAIKDRNLDQWLAHIYTAMHQASDTGDDDALLRLVRNAYEEGVEDGMEWQEEKYSPRPPDWIDSIARVELIHFDRLQAEGEPE
jgi:hypothetical protein